MTDDVGHDPMDEAHRAGCANCRHEADRLRGVVDRLEVVDPDRDLFTESDVPVPASLDARMADVFATESARERAAGVVVPLARLDDTRSRRRWLPVAGGALAGAAAAAALVVALLPQPKEPEPAPVATGVAVSEISTSAGVHAEAWRVNHAWGVEITLRASGLREGREYDVWVIDDAGHEQAAGAFRGVDRRTVTCSVATSVLPAHASRLVVTGPAGKVVISAPIEA